MSIIDQRVVERERGPHLPVTISTAIPIEVLLDTPDFAAKEPDMVCLINIRTLVRNIYQCLDATIKNQVQESSLVDAALEDMHAIESALSQVGIKTHFYACSYNNVQRVVPKGKFKEAKTANQKIYQQLETNSTQHILKTLSVQHSELTYSELDTKLEIVSLKSSAVFILTHSAIDLLSRDQFRQCVLIESHTGNVKNKAQWNTKLTKTEGRDRLPFNKFTLTLFGDGNTYLSMYPRKIREVVVERATLDKWTPVTTPDKIRFSIMKIKDKFTRDWLLKML